MQKKLFLVKDALGFSVWKEKPFYSVKHKVFLTHDYPYDMDKSVYVSEDFVKLFFDKGDIPENREIKEFEINVKKT